MRSNRLYGARRVAWRVRRSVPRISAAALARPATRGPTTEPRSSSSAAPAPGRRSFSTRSARAESSRPSRRKDTFSGTSSTTHVTAGGARTQSHPAEIASRERAYLYLAIRLFARGGRFVDKTPANCLRVSYLEALFPGATFVFLRRRGADNVSSLMEGWRARPRFVRYRLPEPLTGIDGLGRPLELRPRPRLERARTASLEEVCAHQYVECNRAVLDARADGVLGRRDVRGPHHVARRRAAPRLRRARPVLHRRGRAVRGRARDDARPRASPRRSARSGASGTRRRSSASRRSSRLWSAGSATPRNVLAPWSTQTSLRSRRSSERSAQSSFSSHAAGSSHSGVRLLGVAIGGLALSLVGGDDLRLLVTEPAGAALLGGGALLALVGAAALVRYPTATPVALLAAAPFRVPVELGSEEAFLLLPLYLVIAASVLALAYRIVRGERPPPPPLPPLAAAHGVRHAGRGVVPCGPGTSARERSRSHSSSSRSSPASPWWRRRRSPTGCPARSSSPSSRSGRCSPRSDLAGPDAHALLRPRPRGGERVHVLLPGHVALQGSKPVRPVPRDPDRGAPRGDPRPAGTYRSTGSRRPPSWRSSSGASTTRTRSRASSRSSS